MKAWGVIITFLMGVGIGVSGTIFGPDLLVSYLPEAFKRKEANIEGRVVIKKREGNRLLLMVQTAQGAVLATFKEKVAETELLVSEGDLLTLVLRRYEPYLEDPVIGRVRKPEPEKQQGGSPPSAPSGEKEQVPQ